MSFCSRSAFYQIFPLIFVALSVDEIISVFICAFVSITADLPYD